jgi:hypothetical protein
MTVDAFWIDGSRRYCSEFVLGPFCSILHGSILRRKGWTNPTIPSKREYAQTLENSAGWDLEPLIRTVLVQAERLQRGAKSPRAAPPPPKGFGVIQKAKQGENGL